MIVINKGVINTLYFTLLEKETLMNPNFLIKFTSKDTNDSKTVRVISGDISPNKPRWSELLIEEVQYINEDLNNSQINMIEGEWSYTVYETSMTQSTSLTGSNVLETGLALVKGSGVSITSYESEQKIISYNG